MKNLNEVPGVLESLEGTIGACAFSGGQEKLRFHADAEVNAASLIKLPIMAEAFRQREEGMLDFQQVLTIPSSVCCPSCGCISYLHENAQFQVRDLVTLMIILSDNTAANVLMDLLGMDAIQSTVEHLGMTHTHLRRKLFDEFLISQGIQNQTSAGDMALFFRKLMAGEIISPEASREMMDILKNQALNGKIPFHLHPRKIICAHKTGEDEGITHDCGVIFTREPVIFCMVSEHTNVPRTERVMQETAACLAGVEV